jgi:hypothetical protein
MSTNSSVAAINKIRKKTRKAINFDHSVHWGTQAERGCRTATPLSKSKFKKNTDFVDVMISRFHMS